MDDDLVRCLVSSTRRETAEVAQRPRQVHKMWNTSSQTWKNHLENIKSQNILASQKGKRDPMATSVSSKNKQNLDSK